MSDLEKVRELFKEIPTLESISFIVMKTHFTGAFLRESFSVKINGEEMGMDELRSSTHFSIKDSEVFKSFLVSANLKSSQAKLLALTLTQVNIEFVKANSYLSRKDVLGANA